MVKAHRIYSNMNGKVNPTWSKTKYRSDIALSIKALSALLLGGSLEVCGDAYPR